MIPSSLIILQGQVQDYFLLIIISLSPLVDQLFFNFILYL